MELLEILNNDGFSKNMGIEVLEAHEGFAKAKMPLSDVTVNAYGIAHGGAIFTLGDVVSAASAISFGSAYVTMDNYLNFIQPGSGDYLIAEGHTLYKGEKTVVVDVMITNNDDVLVAKGTYTMYEVEI